MSHTRLAGQRVLMSLALSCALPMAVHAQELWSEYGRAIGGGATANVVVSQNGGSFNVAVSGSRSGSCPVNRTINVPGGSSTSLSTECDVGFPMGDVSISGSASVGQFSRSNGQVSFQVSLSGSAYDETVFGRGARLGTLNEVFYVSFQDPQASRGQSGGPSGRAVEIVAQHSGRCMGVPGGSSDSGVQMVQWDCNGNRDQRWVLREAGGNRYEVVNANSGKCLDVNGVSIENGAAIIQWDCNGQDNQRWTLVQMPGGYELVAAHSGKCLDVARVAVEAGVELHQWDCLGANQRNQIFALR